MKTLFTLFTFVLMVTGVAGIVAPLFQRATFGYVKDGHLVIVYQDKDMEIVNMYREIRQSDTPVTRVDEATKEADTVCREVK